MKVAGVIAEYNPFHRGHKYQLEQIRKLTSADYIIVALSGNFLQRGVPALMNKYARANLALSEGADLVIEIPTLWATASAEYYGKAGVTLLNHTGVVDTLCFGAESDSLPLMKQIADKLLREEKHFQSLLQSALKEGISFPLARSRAICGLFSCTFSDFVEETPTESFLAEIDKILSAPNNILALEYLKALCLTNSSMEPLLIQRIGSGYHDNKLSTFASASAIREQLFQCNLENASLSSILGNYLPENVLTQLEAYNHSYGFLDENSISALLGYQLHSCGNLGYQQFADCSYSLAQRIAKSLPEYENFGQFCHKLKTKDTTYTHISRVLCHILLQITQEQYDISSTGAMIPYLHVLGLKRNAFPLLKMIKGNSDIPLLLKTKQDQNLIAKDHLWMFERDCFATNIYNQLVLGNKKSVPKNDFSQKLIVVDSL